MERMFEHQEVCYFIANGWKVKLAHMLQDDGFFSVILTDDQKVIRLRTNRLYKTEEEARQHVTWIVRKKQAAETPVKAAPHYANQYEWMADHHMA